VISWRQEPFTARPEAIAERVAWENHEEPTFRVRPLEERLVRIFDIDDLVQPPELIYEMCGRFMTRFSI